MVRRHPRRTVLLLAYAGGACATTILWPSAPVAVGIAFVPLIFVVPGYFVASAVAPLRRTGFAEFWSIAIGLSVAVDVLAGLVLNFVPGGLTATNWTFFLLALTAIGCLAPSRGSEARVRWSERFRVSLGGGVAGITLAASAFVAAGLITVFTAERSWAVPMTTLAFSSFSRGTHSWTAEIEVTNREGEPVTYRLLIVPQVGSRRSEVRRVSSGHRWIQDVRFSNASGVVSVELFRRGSQSVYRSIWLGPAKTAPITTPRDEK